MLQDLIFQYFSAFSNLYGIVPVRKAYSIIEKQNPELNLTKEEFAETVKGMDFDDKFYAILSEKEVYGEDDEDCELFKKQLIADYILTFGDPADYEALVSEQEYKPYYIPEKDELLKYADDFYFEKTEHYYALESFIKDELGLPNYEDIVEDFVVEMTIDDANIDSAISELRRMGRPKFREFKNKQEAKKFFELYINLRNHSRMHIHRGNTPCEVDDARAANFNIFPSESLDTPSKNGKCPCGSGKKFKRCCMGKGIYD